jgi:hypothetical protein
LTHLAFKEAMVKNPDAIATELQPVLGQKLIAYATGVRSPKLVGRWATGTQPRDDADKRLRELYQVYYTLHEFHSANTVRAFLMGANPDLGDLAPMDAIREGNGKDAVRAAEAFIA